jgi:type II secretory pathway pseudopilin PulG
MSVIIDHLGAIVVSGLILLALTAGLLGQREENAQQTMEVIAQRHLQDVFVTVNHDFPKIGYGASVAMTFLTIKPDSISFLSDLDDNGSIDTVRYYCGPTSALSNTVNPNDFELFRKINGSAPAVVGMGLTRFNLTYVDARGIETNVRELVRGVDVEILVESAEPNGDDNEYAGAYGNVTYYPMNLIIQ